MTERREAVVTAAIPGADGKSSEGENDSETSNPAFHHIADAEIRVWDPDPVYGEGKVYVMEVLGISMLIRRRPGGELDIQIDNETLPRGTPLSVEVRSAGESDYAILPRGE